METQMLLGSLSVGLAFAAALLAVVTFSSTRRRDVGFVSSAEGVPCGGWVAWRVRNGFAPVLPLVDLLMRNSKVTAHVREAVCLLSERHYVTTERTFLSFVVVVEGVVLLVTSVMTASAVCGAAVAACMLAMGVAWVGSARDRRREAIREAVPDALRSMGTCFGAGLTLMQTFNQVASELKAPLRQPFAQAAHVLETGGDAKAALEELRLASSVPELAFVAMALDVQHQTGGSLRQVLDAAHDTIEGELALRRSLRVQTAQAKLSAKVVSIMPLILVAVFSLVSEDFLAPFFASVQGYALLALAVGMQVAGIFLVRRVLATGKGA